MILIPVGVAPYLFPRAFARIAEPDLAGLAHYETAGGALATASANEYLPEWVQDAQLPPVLAADYMAGRLPTRVDVTALPAGSRITDLGSRGLEDRLLLELPAEAAVQVRRFYFPGWQAWLDGRPIAISPGSPNGLIEVVVPVGKHELRLSFGGTPIRQAANAIALAGVALALIGWWVSRKGRFSSERVRTGVNIRPAYRPALAAVAVIILVALLKVTVVEPHTGWFRRQSPSENPMGMQYPVHARFANGVELIGYDLPQGEARQGGTLLLRLYWRSLQPGVTNGTPFVHLDRLDGNLTWANRASLTQATSRWRVGPADSLWWMITALPCPADAPAVAALDACRPVGLQG